MPSPERIIVEEIKERGLVNVARRILEAQEELRLLDIALAELTEPLPF